MNEVILKISEWAAFKRVALAKIEIEEQKERFISPEKRQQIIDELRLV